MPRHLLLALFTVIGTLMWANGAFAADTLTLCINPGGNVKSDTACKASETQFTAVSATAFAALQAQVTALQGKVTTLEGRVSTLETQNTAQQTAIDSFAALLAGVSRTSGPDTLLLTGMNLQVVNGSGFTDNGQFPFVNHENGLGNLIIGYNRANGDTRTGSHNLVIGDDHSYSGTVSVVTGWNNTVGPGFWSFAAGSNNTASGNGSFAAGSNNTASNVGSFVGGGTTNTSSGVYSLVSGGEFNTASSNGSWVGGGHFNTASGLVQSFIAGGSNNSATGFNSFIGGGHNNIASGGDSFVGGGTSNTAGPGSCANIFGTFFPGPAC